MSQEQSDFKTVCKMAVDTYGKEKQIDKLIEEMSELITALLHRRGNPNKGNVEEEIADVEIMIEQARDMFDPITIDHYKQYKISRLESNIICNP